MISYIHILLGAVSGTQSLWARAWVHQIAAIHAQQAVTLPVSLLPRLFRSTVGWVSFACAASVNYYL